MATATKNSKRPIRHEARVTRTVRDAAQETTNKIIAALEAGTVIWHKTWKSSGGGSDLPRSLATGKVYRGVNVFTLWFEGMLKGYTSQYWGTYRQISERGGQVRKGEKSTEIVFWKILEKTEKVDGEDRTKKIPLLRLFHVFNTEQAEWGEDARLPEIAQPAEAPDPIEAAEAIVADYLAKGPSLGHGGDRAFYRSAADHVQVPHAADFISPEAYYSTLYHELTHSTGHESRLDREGIANGTFGAFGDKVYSNEELVAEMGAAILCAVAGIEQAATLDDSAAYINHWLGALKADSSLIIKAASAAQKAVDLVVGTKFDEEES
jgi:antirestriction protein ArdC